MPNANPIPIRLVVGLLFLLLSACGLYKPIPDESGRVKALSDGIISVKSYRIPVGVFRGVLWPGRDDPNFGIWIVTRGHGEPNFQIPTPEEFASITEAINPKSDPDWNVQEIKGSEGKVLYTIESKRNNKSVRLELPVKKREYSFAILRNSAGKEMLVFMDISQYVVDEGLFGYAILSGQESK